METNFPQIQMDQPAAKESAESLPAEAAIEASAPQGPEVVSKAVVRATADLGLTRGHLADILGLSAPTLSRLHAGRYRLDPGRKEWELALLFLRAYRTLVAVVGSVEEARYWLHGENRALLARPVNLIRQTEGLVRVVHYLDAVLAGE